MKWRLIAINPVDGVDAPHVAEKEGEFLAVEESERLVGALIGKEWELPILLGPQLASVEIDVSPAQASVLGRPHRPVQVTQNLHRVRNDQVSAHMGQDVRGFRFGPAKTHRSKRPISMPPFLGDLLRLW